MVHINVNITLSDKPVVKLQEFGILMFLFDAINNLGEQIIKKEILSKGNLLHVFGSNNYQPKIKPGFSHIIKSSPTNLTIVFTNTGAYWIIAHISGIIIDWSVEKENMEKQFQEFLKNISFTHQQELEEIRDTTYKRLNIPENIEVINELISGFENNSNKIEKLAIEINEFA